MFNKIKSRKGPIDYLIVGLGNPGKKYENTRHNAGFMAIDLLAEKHNCKINRVKFKALTGTCNINGAKVLLLKPTTFMNISGESIVEAMNFYKLNPENIIIIYDDITLDVGHIRVRRKGSDGGQKGMQSIINLTGKNTFPRVRVGIGKKPNPHWDLADWVLSTFSAGEQKLLKDALNNTCEAIEIMIEDSTDEAMAKFN